jgi:integrase
MNTTALATQPQAPGDPWARCIGMYLASIRERSEDTYEGYAAVLRTFFALFAGREPDYITREDIERFIRTPTKQDQPPAPGTRNFRLAVLSSLYKFASQYTYRSPEDGKPVRLFSGVAPTAGIRLVKTPRPRRLLTEDELTRLFTAIPHTVIGLRDRSLLTFFLLTGRRLEEGRNLLYGDLEWGTIMESDGSSRLGWTYRWRGEKGLAGEERVSELPTICRVLLEEYWEAASRLSLESDAPVWIAHGPPSLQNAALGKPYDPFSPLSKTAIWNMIRNYAKAAGIDKNVSAHWFRHINAKSRYQASHDVLAVMRALGHTNLSSTYTYLENTLGNADPGARELAHTFNFLLK